jgi:branched-chain amino acid transport system substrate-binding protein
MMKWEEVNSSLIMEIKMKTKAFKLSVAISMLLYGLTAGAENAPGVTKTEIKIGQTTSYSGPAAIYGKIAEVEIAYFKMLNDQGGINGRKINLQSLDDAYSPPKSMEQARKLVEQDEVAFMFNSFGAPTNAAQAKYLNAKKVPQLFVATGGDSWGDYQTLPWSMGWQPSFRSEGRIFAQYILKTKPDAKIAILYQNDDFGRDYVKGVKDVLGDKAASQLVKEVSYEPTDPTVDSQVITLKGSGADHLVLAAVPKFAAQTLRKSLELQWNPAIFITGGASGVPATTEPVRGKADVNIFSGGPYKDFLDASWKTDASLNGYREFFKKYMPNAVPEEFSSFYGYSVAATMAQVLKQCGDDLSRENIMKQASNLKSFAIPTLQDGIVLNTSATDHYPIEQLRLAKWNGEKWVMFGEVLTSTHAKK